MKINKELIKTRVSGYDLRNYSSVCMKFIRFNSNMSMVMEFAKYVAHLESGTTIKPIDPWVNHGRGSSSNPEIIGIYPMDTYLAVMQVSRNYYSTDTESNVGNIELYKKGIRSYTNIFNSFVKKNAINEGTYLEQLCKNHFKVTSFDLTEFKVEDNSRKENNFLKVKSEKVITKLDLVNSSVFHRDSKDNIRSIFESYLENNLSTIIDLIE